ncbi:MAG TPA: acyl-CoA dehydrogenase family protein [Actinomycetota bacterium]|nr:acyl-CoA dehydrogenase family protein [Actinomycetota bacterium]
MDLSLTPEQEAFRREVREWLRENAPRDPEPADRHDAFIYRRRWQGALARAGYVGVTWPEAYGGRGLGAVEQSIVDEEMAVALAPLIAGQIGVSNIGPALIVAGTEEQKRAFLPALRTGDEIWCQGMSEPGAGSDLASLRTKAVRDGDTFVVNGQKIWCSDAHEADRCQLYVRTDDSGAKHAGMTCLIVDMSWPGVEVRPIVTIAGDVHFNEVFFDDVRVPADRVLGEVDQGWRVAVATLMYERTGVLALQALLRRAVQGLLELGRQPRATDGRRPLDDVLIRRAFGDAFARVHVLRSLGYRLLSTLTKSDVPGPEGSLLKLFWGELDQLVSAVGTRMAAADLVLGRGSAQVGGGSVQQAYLQSRSSTIAAGTTEIQKNIIAERVLGLPKG